MILALLVGCGPEPLAEWGADAGRDRFVEVGEEVGFEAGGEGAVAWRWDLGDGTRADGARITHTYTRPGNYGVVLVATGPDGATQVDAARISAHPPLASPAPAHAAALVVDEAGARAWTAIPETDAIVEISLADGAVRERAACAGIRTLSRDGAWLWAACEAEDALVAIEVDGEGTRRIPLGRGARPFGVVARGGVAWATLQGLGALARVQGDELLVEAIGPDPRALALLPDGEPVATRFRSGSEHGEVLRRGPSWTLARQGGADSDTRSRGLPTLLDGFAISPDGGTVAVAGHVANDVRGGWRDGRPLTFETTVRAIVRGVDVGSGAELAPLDRQLDDQGHAGPIAYSPTGHWLFVAHPLTGVIQVLDGWSGITVTSLLDAGVGVSALVPSADGRRLFALAALDRELREWDLSDPVREPWPTRAWRAVVEEPLDAELRLGQRVFHDAGDLRMAKDGYLSCAVCHPDGGDDGVTWDFTDRGEGLRNTTSLLGRDGTGMGPVHWTGNFDEIQDFEHDIRHGGGGSGFLTEAQWASGSVSTPLGDAKAGLSPELDALAAYVAQLGPTPTSPHADDPVGAALFASLGCDRCHPPPTYTDSALDTFARHDVGTWTEASGGRLGAPWDGFDTPTLLGAHATAPYLHDGSAPTVEAALDAHAPDVLTRPYTPDERDAVARFVRSL